MESDVVTLQDIFVAKAPARSTTAMAGSALSPLACTGLKPHFLEKSPRTALCFLPRSSSRRRPATSPALRTGGRRVSQERALCVSSVALVADLWLTLRAAAADGADRRRC